MAKNFTNCIKVTDPKELENHYYITEKTPTYYPIQHDDFYKSAQAFLRNIGVGVKTVEFGLSLDSAKLFMWLETDVKIKDQPLYIGGRNSCDKSMSAGLCVGTQITVCSNKVIASYKNGGVAIRKHSSEANLDKLGMDFEALVSDTISTDYESNGTNYGTFFYALNDLKRREITLLEAKALLTDMYLLRSIAARDIPLIYDQFIHPRHPESNEHTAYNFMMACTEVFKIHEGVDYQINAYDTLARLMHL